MSDYFPKGAKVFGALRSWIFRGKLKKVKATKINILALIILILGMGLFFYAVPLDFWRPISQAEELKLAQIDPEIIDPLEKVGKNTILDQLNDIESCSTNNGTLSEEDKKIKTREDNFRVLVGGYPMELMAGEIAKKEKTVAAFLIGIGKKESNWGKYSPKKNGRDCYNYWGYRGGYNQTESGYSCFDSPKQAVTVVGGRIEELIGKKINTPERMIVWKCGRTCAGHDPSGVKKWISDVSSYFYKLNS